MSDTAPTAPASKFGAWIPGIVLIGLGVIFLVQNYMGEQLRNWWALFLLIPVLFTLERGYSSYKAGRTGEVIGQLWPSFLIIGGLSLLVSRSWRT